MRRSRINPLWRTLIARAAWLPLSLALLCLFAPAQAHALSEEEKIVLLIESVREAPEGTSFIRNGEAYRAADAAAHLNLKYSRMKSETATAEEFIRHVASRSSLSGKEYLIRYPDGSMVAAAAFFMEKLRELREKK